MFDGHQKKAPTPAKKFGCNMCNKSFRLEADLKNHVNAVHHVAEKPLTIEEKRRVEAQILRSVRINDMSTEILISTCQSLHLDYHNKSTDDLKRALRLHYKTESQKLAKVGYKSGESLDKSNSGKEDPCTGGTVLDVDIRVLDQLPKIPKKPITQEFVGREEKRRLEAERKKSSIDSSKKESLVKSKSGRDIEPFEVHYLGE